MSNYRADFLSRAALEQMPFKALGTDVAIHERVTIVGIENISIGNNVRIDPETIILATGPVHIGSFVHIGAQCYLAGRGGITMDDFTTLSIGVKLFSSNDDYSGQSLISPMSPAEFTNVTLAPVHLEEHAIAGAGSILLPGVTVHEGGAIGALSFVTKTTEPWTIYGGVPARAIKPRQRDAVALAARLRAAL